MKKRLFLIITALICIITVAFPITAFSEAQDENATDMENVDGRAIILHGRYGSVWEWRRL